MLEQDIAKINNQVLRSYRSLIGDLGIETFSNRILPLAKAELGNFPNLYKAVLKQLINLAGDLKIPELLDLWKEGVTNLTFKFHHPNLDKTYGPRPLSYLFHINLSSVLQNLTQLCPDYILKGWKFSSSEFNRDPDTYSVCFAKGTTSDLAKFLVGHQLLDNTDADKCHLFEAGGLKFFLKSRLAVANLNDELIAYGVHPSENLLTDGLGSDIETIRSTSSLDIRVFRIPAIVLLPEQHKVLLSEGREFYIKNSKTPSWRPFIEDISPQQSAEIYAKSRHLELSLAYSLSELYD